MTVTDVVKVPVSVQFSIEVGRIVESGLYVARCRALQLAVIKPTAKEAQAHMEAAIEEFVQAFTRTVAATTETVLHEVYLASGAPAHGNERMH